MPTHLERYEAQLAEARRTFSRTVALESALSSAVDPARLERFLIQFCAVGVGMTAPVEGWIRRAGERCTALGYSDLGRALLAHASHEAGHDQLMVTDTRALVAAHNERVPHDPLDADSLIAAPQPPGVERYRALHEEVIEGDAPYGQLAIEYEIEALSVRHGPDLIRNCAEVLGSEIVQRLSFVTEHVQADQGHTAFNALQMNRFLARYPFALEAMIAAGSAALDAYAAFLTDCWPVASRQEVA